MNIFASSSFKIAIVTISLGILVNQKISAMESIQFTTMRLKNNSEILATLEGHNKKQFIIEIIAKYLQERNFSETQLSNSEIASLIYTKFSEQIDLSDENITAIVTCLRQYDLSINPKYDSDVVKILDLLISGPLH